MTRPDRPKQFLDALGGSDGTQAIRSAYVAPPVYPDASLGATSSTVRRSTPVRVRVSVPAVPKVDPQLLAELAEPLRPLPGQIRVAPGPGAQPVAALRPPAVRQPRRTTALAPGGVPAVQYSAQTAPTRQQAASAGHYQGPVPMAVAPAAATAHNTPMSYTGQQWAAFAPGAAPAPPPAPPLPARPATRGAIAGPTPSPSKRRAGRIQAFLFLIIFLLVVTGLGQKLLDLIRQLLDR